MSDLTEADFVPLDDFPLVWRWVERWRTPGSPPVTPSLRAIRPERARDLSERAAALHLSRGPGAHAVVVDASATQSEVREQLLRLAPSDAESVIVSWDPETAVMTTWRVFCLSWDDFCYAGSDDVTVWPESLAWSLVYDHVDEFRFVEWGARPPF